jgi:3-hydroxyacyl-CoA dehydrogenase / enoyl-CoA hydratase / 3-hydroxybutyryl-CoA epimerase
MNSHMSFEITPSGVAIIKLDHKDASLNLLSTSFLKSFDEILGEVSTEPHVNAMVICSAKKNGFIAGADLNELARISTMADAQKAAKDGQAIFCRIADLKIPTIAAINGHCVGGGTELVLACDFRLAAKEKANISLPEVRLGVFPGWGGTQRLPRLISLRNALDMILTGKGYNALKAYRCGLVDMVVPDDIINDYAVKFAEEIIHTKGVKYIGARKKKARGMMELITDKNFIGRFIMLTIAKRQVLKKTYGNYPAPLLAIKAMRRGLSKPLNEGLDVEARLFGQAFATAEHKNLLHIFHLNERSRKQKGVDSRVVFEEPQNMGVLGAGVMGGAIVQLLASKDYPVRIKDISGSKVIKGLNHAESLFNGLVRKKQLTPLEKRRKMEKISGTLSYDGFQRTQVVIEAVAEKMSIKKQVLQEVETFMSDNAVFASNTSALSISELQLAAKNPANVCGMHFFNPVHKMPLVEVIRGAATDDKTVAIIFHLSKKLNKIPIVVKDSPGFLVNRLLGVYLNEACLLAQEKYDFQWIDVVVKKFGMPMGPFRLIDEVGIDIAEEVARILEMAFQDRLKPSTLLTTILQSGILGKKEKKGFYIYRNNRQKTANPSILKLLPGTRQENEAQVINRMMYLMVNEAARCLEEQIISAPQDVDIGMVFGTGFPPFRGGLCKWADNIGLKSIVHTLKEFKDLFGERFTPVPYLMNRKTFY